MEINFSDSGVRFIFGPISRSRGQLPRIWYGYTASRLYQEVRPMADQIASGDPREPVAYARLLGVVNKIRYLMLVVILLVLNSCVTHTADQGSICHGPGPIEWTCEGPH